MSPPRGEKKKKTSEHYSRAVNQTSVCREKLVLLRVRHLNHEKDRKERKNQREFRLQANL